MPITLNSDWNDALLPEIKYADLGMSLKQELKEMEQQRREQHRASMVVFRCNRKERQQRRQGELFRLEREMQLAVKIVRAAASCNRITETTKTPMDALCELVVERELLQTENRSLRGEIQRHEKFHQIVVKTSQEEEKFHPVTREDYEDGLHRLDKNISSGLLSLLKVGNFFGWELQRAPLVYSSKDNKSIVARARLAKRVFCPLGVLLMASIRKDTNISATILTPECWSIHQRHNVSTQVLQEFDPYSCVFVHNIPGPDKHLRCVYFVRQEQWLLPDGRRRLTTSVTIADSDASRHSRNADAFKDQVEWVTEGGIRATVTEVDETSIDVVCDRFAGCHSKDHAEYAMVHWIQYANWWEQMVAPTSLLL